jgi:hypothetical protein
MKVALIAASAALALSGLTAANAQSAGPTYSDTIHQSAGDRDSRGTPKYYHSARHHYRYGRTSERYMRATTGTGPSSEAGPSGPFYDNSIHQSKGRDSRGTPKYYNGE